MASRGLGLLSRKDVGVRLVDHLHALSEAVELCDGRVDSDALADARRIVDQADQRLAISGSATVVALAGATGSGKSSIFNALSSTTLAAVGVRRPTTAHAMACSWGQESAEDLLNWLQIPRRHALEADLGTAAALDGLVLLDLPDHDSTEVDHRIEVDRLVRLVDMLVWVVDPQKYADAAIHDRYLKPLAQHSDVMMIILNQVDTLSATQREQCLKDLRRLLTSEGLAKVPVMAVSAVTGEGIEGLREVLAKQVAEKQAADSDWISGGFFALEPGVMRYIEDDQTNFELQSLRQLAEDGQLMAFKHEKFWQPIDTLRDLRKRKSLF